jgi:hypothetical protein
METNSSAYNLLLSKLDEFIRKYYKNQLIRGLLYAVGILLMGWLTISVLEYFAHFGTLVRTVLFWGFVLAAGTVLARLVFIPLFKLNKIGQRISNEQAATIIGQHFSNVQDKLLNVLQLQKEHTHTDGSNALIRASIDQKIGELKPVPFASAIDLRQNRKYAKYALIPILILAVIIFTNAGLITDGTKRLVRHGEFFEKEAPFQFNILNKSLKAVENQDFPLEIKLTGNEIPESVFILVDGNEYKLERENTISFSYLFRNIQKNKTFQLSADGFTSREYSLEVLPNPIVLNFDVALDYPAYTGKKDESLKNTGDLVVPAGTKITWLFNTRSTRELNMRFADTLMDVKPAAENKFSLSRLFLSGKTYTVQTANEFLKSKDSIGYTVSVVPDLYPSIAVDEKKDSTVSQRIYFSGEVKDDYGFTRLSFHWRSINGTDSTGKNKNDAMHQINVPINTSQVQNPFYYYWDLSMLGVSAGEQIEYYFEVWDNDGVTGAKSTRSQRMIFRAPTENELNDKNDKNNEKIEEKLEQSISESKSLQKDIDELHKKMMEKKSLTWEDKKKLEELTERQRKLEEKMNQIKQDNANNIAQQQEYQKPNESLQSKQEELQKLFDQIMTEDLKKQVEQMQKMIENSDKNKMQEQLEKMKQENHDAEKDLDRTLELFRQMQVEQKLDQTIQKLDELQQKQDSLSKESEKKGADAEDIKQAQDSLNKEFQEVREELDKIQEINEKLEQPNEIPNTDLKEMEVQQQQRESSQQLDNKNKKNASQQQKNAADKMKELSDQLKKAQQEMSEEKQEEDMQALRAILDNLLQLSFDQEALMEKTRNTSVNDPQYPNLAREQARLKADAKMIEDSLLALSKRNPSISPLVNKEITIINSSMNRTVGSLSDRNRGEAMSRQQQAMTSVNNLALMLNESLEQMMQQQNQQNKSDSECSGGKCKKPGNGKGKKNKPSMSSLRQRQQQLNQRMKSMQEGQQKGGQKPGDSEELARMAAEQELIRQMLQKAMEGMPGDKEKPGNKPGGDATNQMEETENDLVNKRINAETMKRQQQILDKMLEYEKAEKERGQDEQRKAEEAKSQEMSNPDGFLEYNRRKQQEAELLKTVPPALSPFYKNKVNEYFNGAEQQ